jgi:hypothetical protein
MSVGNLCLALAYGMSFLCHRSRKDLFSQSRKLINKQDAIAINVIRTRFRQVQRGSNVIRLTLMMRGMVRLLW